MLSFLHFFIIYSLFAIFRQGENIYNRLVAQIDGRKAGGTHQIFCTALAAPKRFCDLLRINKKLVDLNGIDLFSELFLSFQAFKFIIIVFNWYHVFHLLFLNISNFTSYLLSKKNRSGIINL